MRLNLPIFDNLKGCENILIVGAGGGLDVFVGLPIYFTLRASGKTVHLANVRLGDFKQVERYSRCETLIEDLLIGTTGSVWLIHEHFSEPFLAQWFKETRDENVTVWLFANTGAVPLIAAYKRLVEHLNIDAVILVDGGVDSLMRGDEECPGSVLQDSLSLIAVDALELSVKILACIGFGAETEEGVCHYRALENMAALVKDGGFLGSCALTQQMEVFELYEEACRYVWEQPNHHPSRISTRIIPAVRGEFGNYHMYSYYRHIPLFISPLMSLYWFFDVSTVARHNPLVHVLRETTTKLQAVHTASAFIGTLTQRPNRDIPY